MTSIRYTQTLDIGKNGRIEAIRDHTPEEVIFHLRACKNMTLIHELKIRYNIMYDYARYQHWWNGGIIEDYLKSEENYGHLIVEGATDFDFEDNFEPVSPYGCEMFRKGQYHSGIILPELMIDIVLIHTKPPIYHKRFRTLHTGEFIHMSDLNSGQTDFWITWLRKLKSEFDPIKAREGRLRFYTDKKYSEWLRTEVPVDMSMVD